MAISSSPDSEVMKVPKKKKDRTHWLYIFVIIALVAGVTVGLLAPEVGKDLKVLGTMFVSLIKMIVPPVIFCTIVIGIGSVKAAATVGRAGGIAMLYFLVMTVFALAIGLVVGNIIQPGTGLNIPVGKESQFASAPSKHGEGLTGFIQSIIPETFFSAFTSGSVLQVLVIAVLVGFAVQSIGSKGQLLIDIIAQFQKVIFKILNWILWLAPIGAFGAMAGVVGETGFAAVTQLLILILAFYITCFIFVFGVLGIILKMFAGQSIFKLTKFLAREYLLIFATSSSESALPNLMRKMEHMGVDKSTVGIVVPTGYSFNLDGTAIYLTMASIFIADAMHMPMSIGEQIGLLVFMIIASKGAAGVSGAGIATLAAGLSSHRPELLNGVDVIVGIDKFMSEARALTNFAGNSVATILVGKWTNSVDLDRVSNVLDGKIPYEALADDDH